MASIGQIEGKLERIAMREFDKKQGELSDIQGQQHRQWIVE